MTSVGSRIKTARELSGMTQADVCREIDMSRPTYIAIEKGNREPKSCEVVALARLFRCQVSDLVTDRLTLRKSSPLLMTADLCSWVAKVDEGEVSEGCFSKFVGLDRVSARELAASCRAMAKVVVSMLEGK